MSGDVNRNAAGQGEPIVVGYARRAVREGREGNLTLKEKNDQIRRYARERGLKVSRFYLDKSSDPECETGFQALREDGLNGRFNFVITESLDGCGKSGERARQLFLHAFYRLGINFAILEDGINSAELSAEEVEEYFRNHERHAVIRNPRERRRGPSGSEAVLAAVRGKVFLGEGDEMLYRTLFKRRKRSPDRFHRLHKEKEVVSAQAVAEAVIRETSREAALAKRTAERINAGKAGEVLEAIRKRHGSEAQKLFRAAVASAAERMEALRKDAAGGMSSAEREAWLRELTEREKAGDELFRKLTEEVRREERSVSSGNPWIARFISQDGAKAIRGMVKRINAYPDGRICVILNLEGKEAFPQNWLEEEKTNGKEEQEIPGTGK